MKTSLQQIKDFFAGNKIAIAGVSRYKNKFGYSVFKDLKEKGVEVIPINPNAKSIDNVTCLNDVTELPNNVNSLLIITPKHETDKVLKAAINKGIKNIWVQQMSETENSLKIAEEYQKEVIFKKCVYMFAEPVTGGHKFHRFFVKLFGAYPK